MSTWDSLISPEFDYVENEDVLVVKSDREEGKQQSAQSGHAQKEGKVCQRNILLEMGPNENADGFDKTSTDPQFFAPVARDIYMNPRASEYLVAYGWYRQQLQLLGVNACMMIAFKYVERYLQCSSSGRVLCKDEILQMESAVLNYLEL
ncbi:hypothetical protein CCACVL1_07401 [Corchorus capsularis]|uniref:Cyclin N-terminal domain-containing protein n=1 Tax=Corchorus capsularis TaxID=210143 RepID=A0A1R3J674_COCAP|nr:hypothetical protein CCACVL1_07401 [Corchorus capsularis]